MRDSITKYLIINKDYFFIKILYHLSPFKHMQLSRNEINKLKQKTCKNKRSIYTYINNLYK